VVLSGGSGDGCNAQFSGTLAHFACNIWKMAEASTLNCPMCGAATRSDAPNCGHCGARLATVACPSCFGMIFEGSRFCGLCGARVEREVGEETVFPCPRCDGHPALTRITIGKAMLNECGKCHGLWVDKFSFEQICTDREQQAAILGPAIKVPPPVGREKVRYIRCPECDELMQRMNFAGASGVVIDLCRQHGSWFDDKELQRIIEFIRSGGIDRIREKKLAELKDAERRLKAERDRSSQWDPGEPSYRERRNTDAFDAIWATGELLFHFLTKR
jgi:Zn-finger nucleic acid-binding protein